ncbi:hypothetical protein LTR56_018337 [Elasticomyces elasticus]|nr:hypothetical protein LTR22_022201 [Elasticomyces elasticus]KAK3628981.1 hypothetical protein LTR56_018337 [Elasticomyces elasticus]KAK4909212.1 hypothetical protein LTR49_021963 [Elasticomyces elasticus]KAK5743882.1 hypothetical protein LTS12_023683 [Elasticomyces elasticus]
MTSLHITNSVAKEAVKLDDETTRVRMNTLLGDIYCCCRLPEKGRAMEHFAQLVDMAMTHGRATFQHSREQLLEFGENVLKPGNDRCPESEKLAEQIIPQVDTTAQEEVEGSEMTIKVLRVRCCVCRAPIDVGAAGVSILWTTPRRRALHPDCVRILEEKYVHSGGPPGDVAIDGVPDDWIDYGMCACKPECGKDTSGVDNMLHKFALAIKDDIRSASRPLGAFCLMLLLLFIGIFWHFPNALYCASKKKLSSTIANLQTSVSSTQGANATKTGDEVQDEGR